VLSTSEEGKMINAKQSLRSRASYRALLTDALLCVCVALGANTAVAQGAVTNATLSGKVEAATPFRAAKVRATNIDKNVQYMVFTSKGQYRAVGLLPGTYEVTVQKDGFSSDVRTIQVAAGDSVKLDFKLVDGGRRDFRTNADYPFQHWQKVSEHLPFKELYPAGPDFGLVQKACMHCHLSQTYLPAHPRRADEWRAVIKDHMKPESGKLMFGGMGYPANTSLVPADSLTQAEEDRVVAYLAHNFGPGLKRGIRYDADKSIPFDETVLANAMYVEYYLPLDPKLDARNWRRQAQDAHLDKNGNVWYTDNSVPSRVGMLNPRTAEFKDYPLPMSDAYPHGITVDANNEIWWDERDVNLLGRLNQTTGKMTHYLSDPSRTQSHWYNHTPVVDSKGNIWSSHIGTSKIRKWDRETGTTKLYEFETKYGLAYGMDVDKDDNIWVAETGGCRVAKFDQKTEKFTEYPALQPPCEVYRVGVNPYDGTAWFAVRFGHLDKVDPKTGKVTEYPVPTQNSNPYDVQVDLQGKVWFSDAGMGGSIIMFDPDTEKFSVYPTPQWTDIPRLNISAEGALWYCARTADRAAVGVLYPNITKFKEIPSSTDIPMSLMRYQQR
jgi:streptogramin lyase